MTTPLVSICIPVYNGERYLEKCLDSAIEQSYRNVEIIIVDDQSSDRSVSIARAYQHKDARIKLFVNEKNLGLVGNWNRCIDLAGGEWIKFIFQDDYLHPECVERMINVAGDEMMFVVANRKFIFEKHVDDKVRLNYSRNNRTLQKLLNVNDQLFIPAERIAALVSKWADVNFIGEPTAVMFRKKMVKEVGYFNPLLVQVCDLEFWLRVATNYGLFYVPETLAYFRVHEESVSSVNRATEMGSVDRIVMILDFFNSSHYEKFRNNISKSSLARLWEMFKLRIHELELSIRKNPGNDKLLQHYSMIKDVNPVVSKYQKSSWKTKLIYSFVKFRRRMKN